MLNLFLKQTSPTLSTTTPTPSLDHPRSEASLKSSVATVFAPLPQTRPPNPLHLLVPRLKTESLPRSDAFPTLFHPSRREAGEIMQDIRSANDSDGLSAEGSAIPTAASRLRRAFGTHLSPMGLSPGRASTLPPTPLNATLPMPLPPGRTQTARVAATFRNPTATSPSNRTNTLMLTCLNGSLMSSLPRARTSPRRSIRIPLSLGPPGWHASRRPPLTPTMTTSTTFTQTSLLVSLQLKMKTAATRRALCPNTQSRVPARSSRLMRSYISRKRAKALQTKQARLRSLSTPRIAAGDLCSRLREGTLGPAT
mmetsp:Transcript_2138/g.3000  ORF Transcript_2138/g.3000 Transcript_2138/m.3000 type:complete len:310 (-) Transcript_2138:889-1818(-)